MSRTYRYRKQNGKYHSDDYKKYMKGMNATGKDRALHMTDGSRVTWWKVSPYIKNHSNFLRRSHDRKIEFEALRYEDCELGDGERILKHLQWVYD